MSAPQVAFSGGAATFPTVEDFCLFVFGPSDHDAHVKAWRSHQWLATRIAASDMGLAAVKAWAAQESTRRRALDDANAPLIQAACDAANREFEERHALRLAEIARLNAQDQQVTS